MNSHYLFAAAAALSAVAAPAVAQNYQQPYQQAYPQAYPGYGQPGYAQPGYGQNSGVVGQIIDQLLGNRYNVTDRTAVSQCASAALAQAQTQYAGYGQRYQGQGYGGQYQRQGYNQGYNQPMRVTAVSEVQRRSGGLRVKGLIATGQGYGQNYGNQAYGGASYAAQGDLSFRCNVDYRGAVTNLRVTRNNAATPYRRY